MAMNRSSHPLKTNEHLERRLEDLYKIRWSNSDTSSNCRNVQESSHFSSFFSYFYGQIVFGLQKITPAKTSMPLLPRRPGTAPASNDPRDLQSQRLPWTWSRGTPGENSHARAVFGGKKVRGRNIDRFLSRVFVRGCVSIKWHIMGYDREMWVWLGLPHQDLVKFKKTWEVLTKKRNVA